MQVKFLGQGLCEGNDEPVGNELETSIANQNFSYLEVYVAFLSVRAAEFLVKKIESSTNLKAKLYVGVDLQGTSKEALELLLDLQQIRAFVFYTTSPPIYHPKIYVFKGTEYFRVIIGSSNLTSSGLFSNIEASACIDFSKDDVEGTNFLKQLDTFFMPIVRNSANVQPLTQATINILHVAGIVPSQEEQNANRKGKPSPGAGATGDQGLATLFPTRKTTPNPLAKTKAKQVAQPTMAPGFAAIQNPSIAGAATASNNGQGQQKIKQFWIETGSLTGGSRNQLDLSVVSALGHLPHGSLSLFGINGANTAVTTAITIHYQGSDYSDNYIKYPQTAVGGTNGTWRLQMCGRTKSGGKLTPHCRADFIKMILVFTELAINHYDITVHPLSQLSTFKSNSTSWDQNRPKSTGRHFGEL